MSKTANNMREAFAGESQAFQRYLAFAQRAADEEREAGSVPPLLLLEVGDTEKYPGVGRKILCRPIERGDMYECPQ